MPKKDQITIITICDNHFAVMLAALMKSIDINHHSEEHIDLHIVSDNIAKTTKQKLTKCVNPYKISIHWHEMKEVISENTSLPLDNSSYPLNIYARLFICDFLPEHIKKAIYLDVDMIVLKDIAELWNEDLKNNIIGAVTDPLAIVGGSEWTAIPNYKELGFEAHWKYFNSGLLIMDLVKWREQNITPKIFATIEKNKEHTHFPDQYGLNVIFINQWFVLDKKWNAFANQEHDDPAIIHFIINKPIYSTYHLNNKYKELFYYYLRMTPWEEFKPMSKLAYYTQKGKNRIKKKVNALLRPLCI